MPMSKELRAKWLDALRSGNYTQTTGTLVAGLDAEGHVIPRRLPHHKLGYCCLGVLCDVAGAKLRDEDFYHYYITEVVDDSDDGVRDCGELRPGDYGLTGGEIKTLIGMNDDQRYSFTFIADWIEQNIQTKD